MPNNRLGAILADSHPRQALAEAIGVRPGTTHGTMIVGRMTVTGISRVIQVKAKDTIVSTNGMAEETRATMDSGTGEGEKDRKYRTLG